MTFFDGLSVLCNLRLQSLAANWCKPWNSFVKVPEPYTCISRVWEKCNSKESCVSAVSQSLSPEWAPPWRWPRSAGPPPIPQSLTADPHRMNSVLFNFHSLPQTSACCIITSRRPAYTAACWNVRHARAQNPSEHIPLSLCRFLPLLLLLCDNGPCVC